MYYHSHPRLQQYSYNYHTYTYVAERRHTCPYTIIAFSVNGYVSLTGLRVDQTRDTMESTIQNTARQTTYRSIITAQHKVSTVPSIT
jgi:hypothetical protein